MRSDGKLYVPGSEEIIPALKALTDFAHANRIPIVASADDHDLSDPEISSTPDWKTTFPPHCMRGTPGQLKIRETELRNPLVIGAGASGSRRPDARDSGAPGRLSPASSESLDVLTNANVPTLVRTLEPENIVMYGVATDYLR